MTAAMYVLVYAGLMIGLPAAVVYNEPSFSNIAWSAIPWICWLLPVLAWRRDGSSFFNHLAQKVEPLMTGCANLTLLYIFPIIAFHNLVGVVQGVSRLSRRR